ncbi:ATP-binding cassette domain-containing protein [Nonomuraea sp. NPDC050556]|uniref:ATP-binding cassette domain-containing protein n=1 Tax=Nonomuraea sp. NPDC050556 TaxID=3364369 RepID=UPI00378E5BAC
MRRLVWATVRRDRRRFLRLGAWSLVRAAPVFASGHAVARALDAGFLAGRPDVGLEWLGVLAAALAVGAWGAARTATLTWAIVEPIRDALVRRVVRSALSGSGSAGLMRQVEEARAAFGRVLMVGGDFAGVALVAVAGLATLMPLAVPLLVAPLAVALVLLARVLLALAPLRRRVAAADQRVAGEAAALVAGVRDAVASGAEQNLADAADTVLGERAGAARAEARTAAASAWCVAAGGWLPVLLILAFTPWLLGGGASAGEVIGAIVFVLYGVHPALAALAHGLCADGVTLVVTVHGLLARTAARQARDGWGPRQVWQHGNDVVAERLTFAYGRRAEPVVRDLSLRLRDGDHLAVVGPSGVGKTTLAHLLAGVLRPDSGQVTLAGAPLTGFDPALLARRRVLLPQEPYVFTGTLADNLRYFNPHATDDQLATAAAVMGLATPLDERLVRLPPAERQLIALARAYVSHARFVILDEATCHLHPDVEARVEEAFAARPGTLLVVAHRFGSALRARRTLVLDGVKAVLGTHEHLLEHSPLYRDLVESQPP